MWPVFDSSRVATCCNIYSHWRALVLLDEADVFVQERSLNHNVNGLVSVFLRRLEYFQGVMFLTTIRVASCTSPCVSNVRPTSPIDITSSFAAGLQHPRT